MFTVRYEFHNGRGVEQQYTDAKLMWLTLMHLAFVVSALLLGFLEQIMAKLKG